MGFVDLSGAISFDLEGPPTRPYKLSTGKIKTAMIRATADLVEAEQRAYQALDSMIETLRRIETLPPPPPENEP